MLSECGEREDGFNTNRHSQRGRWERGKVIVADWFTQASRIETFEFSDDVILSASDIISSVSLYEDTVIQIQKYTTIITNIKNYKNSSTCQEYLDSIKKHFCTCQDGSWHLKMNNKDFKSKSEVA
jgi:hypothetical protein